MRRTIYVLMETEMDEAIIDRPAEWDLWSLGERADWAATAKETMAHDIAILNGWHLLDDPREEKG